MPITILGKAFNIDTSLKFRGIASVYIGVKSDEIIWPEGVHWLYFDHEEFLFNRVTNSTKLSKEVSPEGYTLLTIESTFSENDELDKYSKKELEDVILEQMKKSGILKESSDIFISSNKDIRATFDTNIASYQISRYYNLDFKKNFTHSVLEMKYPQKYDSYVSSQFNSISARSSKSSKYVFSALEKAKGFS